MLAPGSTLRGLGPARTGARLAGVLLLHWGAAATSAVCHLEMEGSGWSTPCPQPAPALSFLLHLQKFGVSSGPLRNFLEITLLWRAERGAGARAGAVHGLAAGVGRCGCRQV